MKKLANTTAPSSSAEMLAPVTVRTRKMRNGISGSFVRDSMTTNATSSSAESASRRSVQPDPQPCSGAFDTEYTSRARPAVTVTAPPMSWEVSRSDLLSRTNRGASRNAATPTGTLTKKIHSQPAYSVSTPPASTPTAAPEPPIAPQTPSALLRSAPSSKVVMMIESAAGEMIAAPSPWTAREAMSTPSDQASPQRNDAIVNTTTPIRKSRRLPNRSARRPPSNRKPPNVIA